MVKDYSEVVLTNLYSLMHPLASTNQILEKVKSIDRISIEQWLMDIKDDLLRWTVRYINYFDIPGYEPLLEDYENRTGSKDVDQSVNLNIQTLRKQQPRTSILKVDRSDNLDLDYLRDIFSETGPLANHFTNYEKRLDQVAMSEEVLFSLVNNKHLLVQAGTGTGKSLGYLIPAILFSIKEGKSVVISSATINLQEQLLEKDIVAARKAFPDFHFSSVVLKGRNHYACFNRWYLLTHSLNELDLIIDNEFSRQFGRNTELSIKDRKRIICSYILHLTYWLLATPTGDFDTFRLDFGLPYLLRERIHNTIDSGYKTCISDKCKYKKQCLFYQTRELGTKSNIVITNHALLFTLFDPANDDAKGFLETCQHYILDEAHNLEDCITNADMVDIFPELILEYLNSIERWITHEKFLWIIESNKDEEGVKGPIKFRDTQRTLTKTIFSKLTDLDNFVNSIKREVAKNENLHISYPEPKQETMLLQFNSKLEQLYKSVSNLVEILIPAVLFCKSKCELTENPKELAFQIETSRLEKINFDLKLSLDRHFNDDGSWIRWLDADDKDIDTWKLWAAPMSPQAIGNSFFAKYSSVILTSATLTVNNEFDFITERLGLTPNHKDRLVKRIYDGPFDYREQTLVLIPNNVVEPRFNASDFELNNYQLQLANAVIGCTNAFNGGVLALFNSYRDMNAVKELVSPVLSDNFTLLCQGQNRNRSELSEQFRLDGNAVLLATRSFWEGFDVPGQALRCLLLTKLPFNSPAEPIFRARSKSLEDANENSFAQYSLPLAVIRLTQGFGRLIRTKNDYGCIFILDPRVYSKRYGQTFIESFPSTRVVQNSLNYCLQLARDWMKDKISNVQSGAAQ